MPKVKLRFVADVAYAVDYVNPEDGAAVDRIMEGIATKKSLIPCG